MTTRTKETAQCDVRRHFECDGSGRMCGRCGESEPACRCLSAEECESDDSEQKLEKCADCGGHGLICVIHESPALDDRRCDAAIAKAGQ